MATVKPFRALRPTADAAAGFASLPYDVMDTAEARAMIAANPHSFLRVTRAEAELPEDLDPHAPIVYETAKARLDAYIATGILRQDSTECYYIYRQEMDGHIQTGIAAVCTVEEYETGDIRKHELTRPDKEQDRVDHIVATGAQTGPVFLIYRRNKAIADQVAATTANRPAYDFTAEDGIRHTLWAMDDAGAIAAVKTAFDGVSRLYIADGHHRAAAAARASRISKGKNAGDFLAVLFPDDEVRILDYNRVVTSWGAVTRANFLKRIKQNFDIAFATERGDSTGKPSEKHVFGVYMSGLWQQLAPKAGSFDETDLLAQLDVNILQKNLLEPVLGIGDPRTDKRIGFVGGIRGMAELRKLVDARKAVVAFALFPTSVAELMEVADAGEIMPPKSTWFEPKLRDGMVIHKID